MEKKNIQAIIKRIETCVKDLRKELKKDIKVKSKK